MANSINFGRLEATPKQGKWLLLDVLSMLIQWSLQFLLPNNVNNRLWDLHTYYECVDETLFGQLINRNTYTFLIQSHYSIEISYHLVNNFYFMYTLPILSKTIHWNAGSINAYLDPPLWSPSKQTPRFAFWKFWILSLSLSLFMYPSRREEELNIKNELPN